MLLYFRWVEVLVVHLVDSVLSSLFLRRSQFLLRPILLGHPLELGKEATVIFEQLLSRLEVLTGDRADQLAVLKALFDGLADGKGRQVVGQISQRVVVGWLKRTLDDVTFLVRVLVKHRRQVGHLIVRLLLLRRALKLQVVVLSYKHKRIQVN